MFLKVICLVSSIITFFSMLSLIRYKRQIQSLSRQIRFLTENHSNIEITRELNAREMNELVDTLNGLLKKFSDERLKISEKDIKLCETITNISHDIRTPLTSLNGYFELLEQTNDEEEYIRYTRIIKERIDCLKEMLEQLFTYVKLQNNDYKFEYEEFDVCEELCSTLVEFYEEFKESDITPKISVPDEELKMSLNQLAFRRIFENIIKNSIVHGSRYFELTLEKYVEKNAVVVTIKNDMDKVAGTSDDINIERVFDRFYKADKSRSQNSTGLGLAIARDMVLKMNGNIKAEIEDEFFVIKVELFGLCL